MSSGDQFAQALAQQLGLLAVGDRRQVVHRRAVDGAAAGVAHKVDLRAPVGGVERILRLKGAADERKPLSLLCKDLATVDAYALGIDRPMFKLLKTYLPGPYTFILRASSKLPKQAYHDGKRQWKRSEIGVRIPGDAVCLAMLEQLDEPLLCSTVPSPDGEVDFNPVEWCSLDDADWCSQVDFVCDAGSRPVDGSTVYDLSAIADGEEPELLREGLGELIAA